MSENLRETIKKDEAILADPDASPEEKRTAKVDLMISRRLVSKGVEELPDIDISTVTLDRELFSAYRAKAIAYDHLVGECPQPQFVEGKWMVEVDHPAIFTRRASIAYVMTERYKNRDNIHGER